ncbi:hypothetical protein ACROYT_G029741 [Oculina patagonica]
MLPFIIFLVAFLAPSISEACGIRPFGTRIRGGKEAAPHSWPWQASLRFNGKHTCGASLITPEWLVTATHCVRNNPDPKQYKIVLGAHERKNDGEEYDISKVIMYPVTDFSDWFSLKHDVAVLKLSRPAKLGRKVNTICLPPHGSRVKLGTKCFVTGWGRTRPIIGVTASRLKQAEAPLATYDDCRRKNGEGVYDNSMVCVGGKGSSVCNGDSGGPLSCLENGRWVLRGAASWVTGYICPKRKYGVYARVSSYVNWINQQIQGY